MSDALSANWREFLTPSEVKRLGEIGAILELADSLRPERRNIELNARGRSRAARLRKAA